MSASVNTKNALQTFSFILLLTFSVGANASTDKKEETSTKENVAATLDVNFEDIEGLGLFSKKHEGALSSSLWENSKRSSITALLKTMPATSETPEVNTMIFSLLLSKTDPKLIENDIQPENGDDLLTLRMEKLLEAGAYKQAFKLYDMVDNEPYHERLARAGVLSMLYDGDKSLACLETNIVFKRFKDIDFWKTLSAYCDVTLSEETNEDALKILESFSKNNILTSLPENKDYRFIYTDKAYDRLKPLERAILAAEEKLDPGQITLEELTKTPAAYVQPLLRLTELSERQRLVLTIRSVKLGLSTPDALETLYTLNAEPAAGTADEEKATTPKESSEQLSYFYNASKQSTDKKEQWTILRLALPLVQQYGSIALTPYAKLIEPLKAQEASLDEILAVYQILHAAELEIPKQWIELYSQQGFDAQNAEKHADIATVSVISLPKEKKVEENFKNIFAALQTENRRKLLLLQEILDHYDTSTVEKSTENSTYEKDFYLTYSEDYVMQSSVVWDRLKNTSQNKAIGETVLLNVILLHEQNLQNVYPSLLGDILQSTADVGLTDTSKSLAIKASLGSV